MKDDQAPTVRLAATTAMLNNSGDGNSGEYRYPHLTTRRDGGELLRPALLVSYYYLDGFLKHKRKYGYRNWVMDSGAFSAHMSGKTVDLDAYIETCKRLQAEDQTLVEIYALDVIGDWKASIQNTEKMWAAGVEAIPCFHIGEPESALTHIAENYPKIAIGGVARVNAKLKKKFAEQVFARVWPKKIHGFGFGTEDHVMTLPFHSVDATNWELGPCAFGRWQQFGKLTVRGSKQNLRGEVEWYLRLEDKARQRWRKEMQLLESHAAPTVRLAHGLNMNSHVINALSEQES